MGFIVRSCWSGDSCKFSRGPVWRGASLYIVWRPLGPRANARVTRSQSHAFDHLSAAPHCHSFNYGSWTSAAPEISRLTTVSWARPRTLEGTDHGYIIQAFRPRYHPRGYSSYNSCHKAARTRVVWLAGWRNDTREILPRFLIRQRWRTSSPRSQETYCRDISRRFARGATSGAVR